jgi:RNAse (barnase) inhibitor barstar
VTHLLPYIIEKVERLNLRHEVHRFDSGAIMVDIWIDRKFYVIQIDEESIGLSLNTQDTLLFDIIPDHLFSEENQFKKEFAKILPHNQLRKKITLIIDGNNFETLEGFYSEADKILTKKLTWDTGHNLDAFTDLLRGGFGVHEYGEPLLLIWKNSTKSKADLSMLKEGQSLYDILVTIIKGHDQVEFIEA